MDLEEQYFCNRRGWNEIGWCAKSYLETQGISESLQILHKAYVTSILQANLQAKLLLNSLAQEK